jgi:hypothetical protein
MTTFTLTIDDPAQLFALTSATAAKNAGLAAEATPFTDETYLQYVVNSAAASWAQNYPMPSKATYEAAISALDVARLSANSEDAKKLERIKAELTSVKDGKLDEVAAVAVEAEAVKG